MNKNAHRHALLLNPAVGTKAKEKQKTRRNTQGRKKHTRTRQVEPVKKEVLKPHQNDQFQFSGKGLDRPLVKRPVERRPGR